MFRALTILAIEIENPYGMPRQSANADQPESGNAKIQISTVAMWGPAIPAGVA
jgi:hypothetical protein